MNTRIRRGGPGLRIVLACMISLTLGAGLIVYTRTEIVALRYRLGALYERERMLRGQVEKLRLEAAALAAPERLEARAAALGLHYPKAGQVVRLADVARKARE